MSYTALYRKWRPQNFEDVVGQDHVVKTLTNQIKASMTSHAYLLCGTRGTGKTSIAKIFARAVNCQNQTDGSPCNTCDVCKHMLSSQNLNVIEIDAASNNGVDNIREIREEVRYAPTEGQYKVYIIDEVHMLSTGAFNALLKTLEEPPEHVIFILATTEPHKIPATILSRVQRYDLKRISTDTIAETLSHYLEVEQVDAEPKAIRYIAKMGDGSMRDALSIMDQCIAFYLGETITLPKVLDLLGAVDMEVFRRLTTALIQKKVAMTMDIVEEVLSAGRDLSQFLIDEIAFLRNLLLIKTIHHPEEMVDLPVEVIEELMPLTEQVEEPKLIHYIKRLSTLENSRKYASGKRTLVEVELLKLSNDLLDQDQDALMARIMDLEKLLMEGKLHLPKSESFHESDSNQKQQPEEPKVEIDVDAFPEDIKQAINQWGQIVGETSGLLKAMLKEAIPYYLDDDRLTLICKNGIQKKSLSQEGNISTINNILEERYNKRFILHIMEEREYNKNRSEGDARISDIERAIKKIQSKIDFDIEVRE